MGRPKQAISQHIINEVAIGVLIGKSYRAIRRQIGITDYLVHRIVRLPEFDTICALMKAEVVKQLSAQPLKVNLKNGGFVIV